jgi:signal transduction histidine kinase
VFLSFAVVVLFQGVLSILTLAQVTQKAVQTSLDDQRDKTRRLIEQYFSVARSEIVIKADLLAGQVGVADLASRGEIFTLRWQLEFYRNALNLDAVVVLDEEEGALVNAGRAEIGEVLVRRKLFEVLGQGETSTVASEGMRIHLWGLHDIKLRGGRRGVLGVAVSLDRAFIGKIEEVSNTSILLTLRRSNPVNGHLSDQTFLEYSRRITADPGAGDNGRVGPFLYRTILLADFPDLEVVYFIDTTPANRLLSRYLASTLVILAIALLAAFAVSLVLYRYSFLRPFRAFEEAIRRISQGDLSFRTSRRGAEEFAALEREFEQMTANLRKVKSELQINSRMAAIGEMTAGVAHQIRNPLAIMKVSAELIRDRLPADGNGHPGGARHKTGPRGHTAPPAVPPGGSTRQLIEMIVAEIDSLSMTVVSFLDFARPLRVRKEHTNPAEIISRAVANLPADQIDGRRVTVDVHPEVGFACLDATLMEQVVHNLVVNGLQATSPGGVVCVTADRKDGKLRIRVRDTGKGMTEQVKSQVFHPFFTTKKDGTGLGLSVVHRIVEEHGGGIEVRSQIEQGTEFEIVFQE